MSFHNAPKTNLIKFVTAIYHLLMAISVLVKMNIAMMKDYDQKEFGGKGIYLASLREVKQ